jgi:hypothetical protein
MDFAEHEREWQWRCRARVREPVTLDGYRLRGLQHACKQRRCFEVD